MMCYIDTINTEVNEILPAVLSNVIVEYLRDEKPRPKTLHGMAQVFIVIENLFSVHGTRRVYMRHIPYVLGLDFCRIERSLCMRHKIDTSIELIYRRIGMIFRGVDIDEFSIKGDTDYGKPVYTDAYKMFL